MVRLVTQRASSRRSSHAEIASNNPDAPCLEASMVVNSPCHYHDVGITGTSNIHGLLKSSNPVYRMKSQLRHVQPRQREWWRRTGHLFQAGTRWDNGPTPRSMKPPCWVHSLW